MSEFSRVDIERGNAFELVLDNAFILQVVVAPLILVCPTGLQTLAIPENWELALQDA